MNDWGHYHASGYSYNDPIVAIVLDTQTRAKNGGMYVLLPLTLWVLSSHMQPDRWMHDCDTNNIVVEITIVYFVGKLVAPHYHVICTITKYI